MLVHRLLNPLGFVVFKMGRRLGKRVGGSAYWRIGVWGKEFDRWPTLPLLKKLLIDTSVASEFDRSS